MAPATRPIVQRASSVTRSAAQSPEGRQQLASEDVPRRKRRGDQAVPRLASPLADDSLAGHSGGDQSEQEDKRRRDKPQVQVQVGPCEVGRRANVDAGQEEPDRQVPLRSLRAGDARTIAVVPDLDQGGPGEEEGDIREDSIKPQPNEKTERLREQPRAGGVQLPPKDRVVTDRRFWAPAPARAGEPRGQISVVAANAPPEGRVAAERWPRAKAGCLRRFADRTSRQRRPEARSTAWLRRRF